MMGGMHGGGHAWQGCVCDRGACMAGGCMVGGLCGRGRAWQILRDTVNERAGGTHPTGMHSCSRVFLVPFLYFL